MQGVLKNDKNLVENIALLQLEQPLLPNLRLTLKRKIALLSRPKYEFKSE